MWFVNGHIRVFVTPDTTEEELEKWFAENCEEQAWEIDIFQPGFCQKEEDEIRFWGDDGIFTLEKEVEVCEEEEEEEIW